jgi:hypothetical protein
MKRHGAFLYWIAIAYIIHDGMLNHRQRGTDRDVRR